MFTILIVGRFENINPKKDRSPVRGTSNIKNEIKIITVAYNHFKLWEEFFTKH